MFRDFDLYELFDTYPEIQNKSMVTEVTITSRSDMNIGHDVITNSISQKY